MFVSPERCQCFLEQVWAVQSSTQVRTETSPLRSCWKMKSWNSRRSAGEGIEELPRTLDFKRDTCFLSTMVSSCPVAPFAVWGKTHRICWISLRRPEKFKVLPLFFRCYMKYSYHVMRIRLPSNVPGEFMGSIRMLREASMNKPTRSMPQMSNSKSLEWQHRCNQLMVVM